MDERIKRSRRQEKESAKAHGGRLTPGSGSRWNRKGDHRTKTTRVENKRTDNQRQITLRAIDLEKIWAEAWADMLIPLLEFELRGRSYVVQVQADYLEREQYIQELEDRVAALEERLAAVATTSEDGGGDT